MAKPLSRRNMLKALGAGAAGVALSQAGPDLGLAPAARASTIDSTSDSYVINGEFFTLALDKTRGGLISDVQLFDGSSYRSLNPPGTSWGDVHFGPYALANATDGQLVSSARLSDHVRAEFTATPRDPNGSPAGFIVDQVFAVYDAGVVDVIITTATQTTPTVQFPVNDNAFPRSQSFHPGGVYSHQGVTETGLFLSSRPVGYANGLQTWQEGPYASSGGYQSGWGFVLAVQRQNDPLIGTRTVHWQDEEGDNVIWPPDSYIDACADLGINLSVIHIYWKKYQWGEPNYRLSGNFGDLRRFVERNKSKGITPMLYAMPHYDPSAETYFGLNSEWYDKTGAEGIYFDFGSDYFNGAYELPQYDKLVLHNYTLRNTHFRHVVGADGVLIAHSSVSAPDLHFLAFCNAYLPGEATAQAALADSPDQASTIGGLAYAVVKPWTVWDVLKDDKAFSMYAGAGIYPHALTGYSTHASGTYGSGLLNSRNPYLALRTGFAPYFQLLRAIPMGTGTTLYNFNTTQVVTADSQDALVAVYRRRSTDETLVVTTNHGSSAIGVGVQLDQQALGMSGAYDTYLIAGNTVEKLAVTPQGANTSGKFTTPSLAQYEYCGMLFTRQDKSSYLASVAAVRAAYIGTEPPSQVIGVRAEDVGKAVRLTWDAAAKEDHVAAYYVYRSDNGGTFQRVNPSMYDYDEVNWFTDRHAAPSTRYTYKIAAVDVAGNEGQASEAVSIVVNGGRPPSAANYTAVKLLSASEATSADTGFKFRYQDGNNYYSVYFGGNGGGDGGFQLSKVVAGTATTLAWEGFAHQSVFEHVLRVEAYGPKLRVYSDGIFQMEATDTTFVTGMPVDADLVTENIAFGAKVVDFSTQRPGAEAVNVTDGDVSDGVWETTSGNEQYVTIELGDQSVPVAQIRIKAGFDIETPDDMTIGDKYDSTNPKQVTVFSLDEAGGTGQRTPLLPAVTLPALMSCRDVSLSLPQAEPVRYLQLAAHTGYAADYMIVGEIEAYPPGEPPQPTAILTSITNVALMPGQTQTVQATVISQYKDPIEGASLSWVSADPSVASVDAGGTVTAARDGVTTVEAVYGQLRSQPVFVIVGVNVALRKPVTGFSSQYNGSSFAAKNINDGQVNATSRGWAASGTNQWVIIDLGASYTLDALRITGEDSLDDRNVRDYVLFGSDTGAFTGEEHVLDSGTVPPLKHLSTWAKAFPAGTVRYVKFLGKTSYSSYIIVGELELFSAQ